MRLYVQGASARNSKPLPFMIPNPNAIALGALAGPDFPIIIGIMM
jgi:hypothetical protein